MRVEIVVFDGFDGFDELDVSGPFEVLSTPGIDVGLVTIDRPRMVVTQRGLEVRVEAVLSKPDGIIVPGGGWGNKAPVGAWAESQRGDLARALHEQRDRVDWIASVCTGAMLLATAGLLDGREATTNRTAFEDLRPYVSAVLDERVVDAGDRVTAGGLSAGLDLGLALIARAQGPGAAEQRARSLEYQPQGRIWRSASVGDAASEPPTS